MSIGRMLLPLIAMGVNSVALAASPFDGTWTLDIGKSRVLPVTLSWQDAGNGRLRFENLNLSYTFKPDGREFTTPVGLQQTIEKISNTLYRVVTRRNGSVLTTETWSLSPDSHTLVMESKGTRPNGQAFDIRQTYARISGSTGLVGNWRGTWKIQLPENTLTISTQHDDVAVGFSANASTFRGRWDGKAHSLGPKFPKGATATLSRTGNSAFTLIYKVGATVYEVDQFSLASDHRSLVQTGSNGKGRKLFVDVWTKAS